MFVASITMQYQVIEVETKTFNPHYRTIYEREHERASFGPITTRADDADTNARHTVVYRSDMSSCLLPTLVLLQSSPQDPELATHKPTPSSRHPPARQTRTKKRTSLPNYYRTNANNTNNNTQNPQIKNTKMLLLRPLIPLLSLAGLAHVHAQSSAQSTWAQTQPFAVAPESSTDALLGSSQQPLTNALGATSTTGLPPAVSVTDMFSVSIPTEVASLSRSVSASGSASASVSQSSGSASASGSRSGSASTTPSASTRASSTSSSASAGTQSTGAAAGPQRYVGVVGALAGVAGVLLV